MTHDIHASTRYVDGGKELQCSRCEWQVYSCPHGEHMGTMVDRWQRCPECAVDALDASPPLISLEDALEYHSVDAILAVS